MVFGIENTQPELYAPENRETIKFYFFNDSENSSLMNKKTDRKEKPLLEKAKDILGGKLYGEISEAKEVVKLDRRSVFEFFNNCFLTNQLLSNHGCFLKFFERRDQFCYLIKKSRCER